MALRGPLAPVAFALLLPGLAPPAAGQLYWPTPDRSFVEGKPYEEFVQPTVSGLTESGMFGCVRNGRRQFHEGLDLKPVERDRRGEPADPVYAVLPGVVRHVSRIAGHSSYGRYVVLEHEGQNPAIVTLYAHLLSIAPGIRPGSHVEAGQTLGIMGRSAAGYSIPRDRGHLHIEAGVWLSQRFQAWYDAKKFGSRNEHGNFNGMNIAGFDFLDLMERLRGRQVRDVEDYLARLPIAATVFVRSSFVPDFVRRYPSLVENVLPRGELAGWEIEFTWFGLPKRWRALNASQAEAIPGARTTVIYHDQALLDRFPCQEVIRTRKGNIAVGERAQDALDILFTGE